MVDDVALDELALLARGLAEGRGGESIEIAHGAGGGLVEEHDFYAEMCRVEQWSTRDLRERIDSMLYERTALSKKPEALIRQELSALRGKGELRWLDRHERQPSEQAPLGIILCAGKKRETVEYLDLDARGIHVAEYLTELPPRAVREDRLHRAIQAARDRLALAVNDPEVPRASPTHTGKRRTTKDRAPR